MLKKLKRGAEGFVIVLIGVFLLVNAMNIPENPIKYQGWTNNLAQAKFVPLMVSIGITILGIILLVKQLKGADKSAQLTKEEWIRLGVVLVLCTLYIITVYKFKFLIPTIVFAFAILFFLNWKVRKTWQIVALAILAIVLGVYGMPYLINLKLPML